MSEADPIAYKPQPDTWDEAHSKEGTLRSTWEYMLSSLCSLGAEEILDRQQRAMRILRDDGATYTVYDRQGGDRTWPLDLIPWLIDSAEWLEIEAGLQERAELFDLILQDIYDRRELITRGIIPPEVIFGHSGFLRACQGIKLPGEHQMISHAADMVRRADGKMCVLTDRTQAPSGAGYALENRTVMNRVLPSLFRDSHVHRLASYFQCLRQTLMRLAPHVSRPEIAVLTPGAYNETYFEHAYLANYLGFRLVQSSDLTVRDGKVWVKSLSGLTRIDVILRRVDDVFCDQVELKGDSQLGIPGLLQVIRAGNVAVANPLGAGILENPALLRYLPAISEHFLGRQLRLDTVRTLWCGDSDDLDQVLKEFDQFVIKRVTRGPEGSSQVVSELSPVQREKLIRDIHSEPADYVAQEKLVPSHMPVFSGQDLAGRPGLLRAYSVSFENSYRVMPGGLTRVGSNPRSTMISNQLGSTSKDTWILASEPEKQTSLWPQEAQAEAPVSSEILPSRVVDNLFWMARYAERSINVLRLIRSVFSQLNSSLGISDASRQHLLQTITHFTLTYPGFIERQRLEKSDDELLGVILDERKTGSVSQCIQAMVTCSDESRDLLSTDSQRIINDISDQLQNIHAMIPVALLRAPERALNPLVTSMLALTGIVAESMPRGMAWQFFEIGFRLERANQTLSMLLASLIDLQEAEDEAVTLENLLLTFEGLLSYRRYNPSGMTVSRALVQVLQDAQNPRSVIYQLHQLQEHLSNLPGDEDPHRLGDEQRTTLEAISLVSLVDVDALSEVEEGTRRRVALLQFLMRARQLVNEISNLLTNRYFKPAPAPSQLLDQSRGNR